MSFLRNVKADLVDKRLWPVAVALVVALVAVPIALGRGGGSHKADAGAGAQAAPASGAPTAQVTLDTSVSTKEVNRKGRVRDPFAGNAKKSSPSTKTTASGAPSGGASSSSSSAMSPPHASSPSTPAPAAGGGGSTSVSVAPARPVATKEQIAKAVDRALKAGDGVTVRFSSADRIGHAQHIGPMAALPSSSYPFVVFGGLSDAKTAVFIVAANVRATGDGKCSPSPKACQLVALHAGDVEQLDYLNGDGRVKHYAMRVLRVHGGGSSAGASTARTSRKTSPWALATARHAALVAARAAGR